MLRHNEIESSNSRFGVRGHEKIGSDLRAIFQLETQFLLDQNNTPFAARDSFIGEWVGQTVGSTLALPVLTQNLLVTLLNDDGFPLVAWGFANAYPVRCEVASLDALDNKILTETLELSYNYFERVTLGSAASVAVKLAQLAARLSR